MSVTGSFLALTSGGPQQTISLPAGTEPRAVILYTAQTTADGRVADDALAVIGMGTYDGSVVQQACIAAGSDNGTAADDTASLHQTSALLRGFLAPGGTTPTIDFECDLISMQGGGTPQFVIEWVDFPAAGHRIHYFVLTTTECASAKVVNAAITTGVAGATQDIPISFNSGNDPTAFLTLHAFRSALGEGAASAHIAVGAWDRASATGAASVWEERDAQTTMATSIYQLATAAIVMSNNNATHANIAGDASANWPAANIRIVKTAAPSATRQVSFLALEGAELKCAQVTTPTTGTTPVNVDTDCGWTPSGMLVFGGNVPAGTGSNNTHAEGHTFTLGSYDGTNESMIGVAQDDAALNSGTERFNTTTKIVRYYKPPAVAAGAWTLEAEADGAFSGNLARLSFTDTDSLAGGRASILVAFRQQGAAPVQITASDAFVTTDDAGTIAVAAALTDVAALADAAGSIAATLAAPDTFTLVQEIAALMDMRTASDALTQSEVAATIQELILFSASDSGALAEAAAVAAAMTRTDANALTDNAGVIAVTVAAADVAALAEALTIAAALAATDAWTLAELATASRLESLSASDASTLAGEAAATALDLSRTDSMTQSEGVANIRLDASDAGLVAEALAITATMAAQDALVLSEAATGGEFRDIAAIDALVLSEASALQAVTLLAAADALTLGDSATVAAALDRADMSAVIETLTQASALLNANDQIVAAEAAALAANLARFDVFALGEDAFLNTAQFVRIIAALASAAATIKSMASAQTTIKAAGAASAAVAGDSEAIL